nr:MAG TPA: hypothetical protein [Caudoviricetes sp.]
MLQTNYEILIDEILSCKNHYNLFAKKILDTLPLDYIKDTLDTVDFYTYAPVQKLIYTITMASLSSYLTDKVDMHMSSVGLERPSMYSYVTSGKNDGRLVINLIFHQKSGCSDNYMNAAAGVLYNCVETLLYNTNILFTVVYTCGLDMKTVVKYD